MLLSVTLYPNIIQGLGTYVEAVFWAVTVDALKLQEDILDTP